MYFNGIVDPDHILEKYPNVLKSLLEADYQRVDLEKKREKSGTIYSLKINNGARIIAGIYENNLYVLSDFSAAEHDKYERFINQMAYKCYKKSIAQHQNKEVTYKLTKQTDDGEALAHPVENIIGISPLVIYGKQVLELTDVQEQARLVPLPAWIIGSAGAGKTVVMFDILKQLLDKRQTDTSVLKRNDEDSPVVYLAPHALAADMKQKWHDAAADHNFKPSDVLFLTVDDLVRQIYQHIGVAYQLCDQTTFASWLSNALKRMKLSEKQQTFFKKHKQPARIIYHELKLIQLYDTSEYLDLGERTSYFEKNDEFRELALSLHEKYKKYLSTISPVGIDLNLTALDLENLKVSYFAIDEAQETPSLLSHELSKHFPCIWAGDEQQTLDDLITFGPIGKIHKVVLDKSHRVPSKIAAFVNRLLRLQRLTLEGRVTRYQQDSFESALGAEGAVEWLDSLEDCDKLKALIRSPEAIAKIAIIVFTKDDLEKAQEEFNTQFVFLPHEILGLEFDSIVLYNVADVLNRIEDSHYTALINDGEEKNNRPKETGKLTKEEHALRALHEVYIAATRTMKSLYLIANTKAQAELTKKQKRQATHAKTALICNDIIKAATETAPLDITPQESISDRYVLNVDDKMRIEKIVARFILDKNETRAQEIFENSGYDLGSFASFKRQVLEQNTTDTVLEIKGSKVKSLHLESKNASQLQQKITFNYACNGPVKENAKKIIEFIYSQRKEIDNKVLCAIFFNSDEKFQPYSCMFEHFLLSNQAEPGFSELCTQLTDPHTLSSLNKNYITLQLLLNQNQFWYLLESTSADLTPFWELIKNCDVLFELVNDVRQLFKILAKKLVLPSVKYEGVSIGDIMSLSPSFNEMLDKYEKLFCSFFKAGNPDFLLTPYINDKSNNEAHALLSIRNSLFLKFSETLTLTQPGSIVSMPQKKLDETIDLLKQNKELFIRYYLRYGTPNHSNFHFIFNNMTEEEAKTKLTSWYEKEDLFEIYNWTKDCLLKNINQVKHGLAILHKLTYFFPKTNLYYAKELEKYNLSHEANKYFFKAALLGVKDAYSEVAELCRKSGEKGLLYAFWHFLANDCEPSEALNEPLAELAPLKAPIAAITKTGSSKNKKGSKQKQKSNASNNNFKSLLEFVVKNDNWTVAQKALSILFLTRDFDLFSDIFLAAQNKLFPRHIPSKTIRKRSITPLDHLLVFIVKCICSQRNRMSQGIIINAYDSGFYHFSNTLLSRPADNFQQHIFSIFNDIRVNMNFSSSGLPTFLKHTPPPPQKAERWTGKLPDDPLFTIEDRETYVKDCKEYNSEINWESHKRKISAIKLLLNYNNDELLVKFFNDIDETGQTAYQGVLEHDTFFENLLEHFTSIENVVALFKHPQFLLGLFDPTITLQKFTSYVGMMFHYLKNLPHKEKDNLNVKPLFELFTRYYSVGNNHYYNHLWQIAMEGKYNERAKILTVTLFDFFADKLDNATPMFRQMNVWCLYLKFEDVGRCPIEELKSLARMGYVPAYYNYGLEVGEEEGEAYKRLAMDLGYDPKSIDLGSAPTYSPAHLTSQPLRQFRAPLFFENSPRTPKLTEEALLRKKPGTSL